MAGDIARIYNTPSTRLGRSTPVRRPWSAGPPGRRPGRANHPRQHPDLTEQHLNDDADDFELQSQGVDEMPEVAGEGPLTPTTVRSAEHANQGDTWDTASVPSGHKVNPVDVSKVNTGKHNSQKLDTFFTPRAPPVYLPGGAFRHEWLQEFKGKLRRELKEEMMRMSQSCTKSMSGLMNHCTKAISQTRAGMDEEIKTAAAWLRQDFNQAAEEIKSTTLSTGGRISAAITEDLKDELSSLRQELRSLQEAVARSTVVSSDQTPKATSDVTATKHDTEGAGKMYEEVREEISRLRKDLVWLQTPETLFAQPEVPQVSTDKVLEGLQPMLDDHKATMGKLLLTELQEFKAGVNEIRADVKRSSHREFASTDLEPHSHNMSNMSTSAYFREVHTSYSDHLQSSAAYFRDMASQHFAALDENLKANMAQTHQGINQINENLCSVRAEIQRKENMGVSQVVMPNVAPPEADLRAYEEIKVQLSALQHEFNRSLTEIRKEVHASKAENVAVPAPDVDIFAPHFTSFSSQLKIDMSSNMSLVFQGINQVASQIGEALSELRRESHTHQICQDTNRLIQELQQEIQQKSNSSQEIQLKSLDKLGLEMLQAKLSEMQVPGQDFSEIHKIVNHNSSLISGLSRDYAETRDGIQSALGEIAGMQIMPYKELQTEIGLLRQDLSAPWVPILHEEASLLRRGLAGIEEELKAELHLIRHNLKGVSTSLEGANYGEMNKELLSQSRNCADAISEMRAAVCGIGGNPHMNGDLMSEMNQVRQEFARAVAEIKSASQMAASIPQLKAEVSLLRQDFTDANKTQTRKAQAEVETLHLLKAELMQLHQDRTQTQEELHTTVQESFSRAFRGGNISEIVTEIRESKAFLAQEAVVLQKAGAQINHCASFAQEILSEIRNTKMQESTSTQEILSEIRNTKMQKVHVEHLAERTSVLTDVIREELGSRPPHREDSYYSPLATIASPSISPVANMVSTPHVSLARPAMRKLTPGEHLEVLECKNMRSHTAGLSDVVLNCAESNSAKKP